MEALHSCSIDFAVVDKMCLSLLKTYLPVFNWILLLIITFPCLILCHYAGACALSLQLE